MAVCKALCMWNSRLHQTDQRAETRSLPPGWIPVTLLTLCLWSVEPWMGHGSIAAVLRQPSLMGLTVGVPVKLYACQCPRGLENMQSKSRGAWGNVKAGTKYSSWKGQPCWSQGNPARTAVLHSCVWILSQSCFMGLCLCMGLGQDHTGSHKTQKLSGFF